MQGLSAGTVLAAALRPMGLVAVPRFPAGGPIEVVVMDSQKAAEHWPIGWPPEKAPLHAAPELFDRLDNVEIRSFALKEALDAIEQRLGVPFLYDRNALAAEGIDLQAIKVTLVKPRLTYFSIVQQLLSSAKRDLRVELRLDEAGKPFLWFYCR
jgi:hypothetical protein